MTSPNIVFIIISDMGWRDVGFLGCKTHETPNIDRLAHGGIIFPQTYSCGPNCAPSRASIMSGMYTPRHEIYTPGGASKGDVRLMKLITPARDADLERFPSKYPIALKPDVTCIPQVLKSAGYTCGAIGKWQLGNDPEAGPISKGFDHNVGGHQHMGRHFSPYKNPAMRDGPEGEYLTDRLTDEAVQFIQDNRDGPFFLYLAHWALHAPILAKADKIAAYEKAGHPNPPYGAMVESVDESVGRVMQTLDDLGLADNTLVILSADHGGIAKYTDMDPLRGGKGALYEGGIRVSTCMRWPGVIPAGTTCDVPIYGIDFMPTLTEVTSGTLPEHQPVDGESLIPLFSGATSLKRDTLYWHFPLYLGGSDCQNITPLRGGRAGQGTGWRTVPSGAIRKGDWKLIEQFDTGSVELYNIADDIGEQNDLATDYPEKATELLKDLKQWQRNTKAIIPNEPNPYYDMEYERAVAQLDLTRFGG